MLRGSVAHTTLHRFYAGLPRALGSDTVDESTLDDALTFLGECLEGALGGVKMEMTELERRELEQSLRRDLEQFVRDEARSPSPLVPRKFEVGFGSERSAPELQRGLDLGDGVMLSGKIDRIDVDPGSARGIVQDYKSGRYGHSAAEIEKELRLQIPLYMLVLRDLVGIEPLGGLYRPLAGERRPRGLLRAEAKDDVLPGFVKNDYLEEDAFWARSRVPASSPAAWRSGSARATCATTRRGRTAVLSGATSGACAGSGAHEAPRTTSRRRRSRRAARSSSPRAPAPARRRCSSSGSPRRCASAGSTSTRCS